MPIVEITPRITPTPVTITEPTDVEITYRDIDIHETQCIHKFLEQGCGCTARCSSYFDESHYAKMRSDCLELTHDELDLVIMGELLCCTHDDDEVGPRYRHASRPRQRLSTRFQHKGRQVIHSNTFAPIKSCVTHISLSCY